MTIIQRTVVGIPVLFVNYTERESDELLDMFKPYVFRHMSPYSINARILSIFGVKGVSNFTVSVSDHISITKTRWVD